jgi:hypothetical protein
MIRVFSRKRPQHRELLKLFSAFGDRLEDYDSPPADAGYWYGERALTGFFAAAAWSLPKGWSVEEFTGLRRQGRKKGSGRGDIWVGVGSKTYTIEAKVVWPGGSVDSARKTIENSLSEATNQLKNLEGSYREGRPVALCYVVPDLNQKGRFSEPSIISRFFTELPTLLADRSTVVGSFWYNSKPPSSGVRVYPGVTIVGRILDVWR